MPQPPAPIDQTAPRTSQPAQPSKPERAPTPEKKPVQPAPRGTQVYAYRDPSSVPEPAASPATAQPPAPAPTPPSPGTQAPPAPPGPSAPERSATPPQRPDEEQVAKVDPRSALPATEAPRPEPPAAPAAPAPAPALPPSNLSAPNLPPAAASLAGQAEQQRQAGDHAGAAASLERSLRIAPREAYLWNRLARVRLEQGQAVQAGNLASRANDLAGDKDDLKRDNWRIIAESKRRSGDLAAASEAEQRAGGQ
ncbi:hypothetical protein [Allochromatium palmeri]|nr:hypothetical protein [Allochromatium palmeri]